MCSINAAIEPTNFRAFEPSIAATYDASKLTAFIFAVVAAIDAA